MVESFLQLPLGRYQRIWSDVASKG